MDEQGRKRRMRVRICMHGRQTDGKEINQTAIFRHRFFYKTLYNTKQTSIMQ